MSNASHENRHVCIPWYLSGRNYHLFMKPSTAECGSRTRNAFTKVRNANAKRGKVRKQSDMRKLLEIIRITDAEETSQNAERGTKLTSIFQEHFFSLSRYFSTSSLRKGSHAECGTRVRNMEKDSNAEKTLLEMCGNKTSIDLGGSLVVGKHEERGMRKFVNLRKTHKIKHRKR